MDKGTLIRTIALVLALANQLLVALGYQPFPVDEEQLYMIGSTVVTLVVAIIAWFKNNFVTKTGKAQKEVLKQAGLTKAK